MTGSEEYIGQCNDAIEKGKEVQSALVDAGSQVHDFQQKINLLGDSGEVMEAQKHAAMTSHNVQLAHARIQESIRAIEDVIAMIQGLGLI